MPTTDSPAPDPRFDRQARYISALEQLADPAPVTRLSGAQSLVWLIDEWLADETLPGPTRHAEATALIDSLCAYIRSPYPMAPEYEMLSRDEPDPALSEEDKRNFPHDKAEFDAEVTVRLTLLLAVHTRVIGTRESPGPWSGFAYDFSGSVFFYPVNLSGSYWSVPLNMAEATFCADADFSSSTYLADAIFNDTVFNGDADFSHSIYGADVHFNKVHFNGVLNASSTIYEQGVSIQGVCLQEADLSGCLYHGNTWIDIAHHGHANLSRCLYYGEHIDLSSSYLQGVTANNCIYHGKTRLGYGGGERLADYSRSVFFADLEHDETTFVGPIDYSHNVYYGHTEITINTYQGDVTMRESIYLGQDTALSYNTYEAKADFGDCLYLQCVPPPEGEDYGVGNAYGVFSGSCYEGPVTYGPALFCQSVSLDEVQYGTPDNSFAGCIFNPAVRNTFTVDYDSDYEAEIRAEYPVGSRLLNGSQVAHMNERSQHVRELAETLLQAPADSEERWAIHQQILAVCNELKQWAYAL